MRTIPQAACPNCDADGAAAHGGLRDLLYGSSGIWRMKHCGNARCGVYWLDPAPHPDDLALAYQGYHTHATEVKRPLHPAFFSAVRDAFVARKLGFPDRGDWLPRQLSRFVGLLPERSQSALYAHFYLPWQPDGKLLEIGCGAGKQLELLAQAGWDVRGVDFDPEAVAVARRRGLDVMLGDVRELDLPEKSFDAVVMAQVLEHVFDPVGLLTRCVRLLKPGGVLVSITPNADSLGHRVFGASWRGLEPPRHIVVYTPRGLRLACDLAGLAVERLDVTARDAANMLLASWRIRSSNGRESIRLPQAGKRPPVPVRMLAGLERVGNALGLAWGEELVLTARKASLTE